MSAIASQITSVSIVCSTVGSGVNQRKIWKLRVTDLCAGNPPVTGEFPAQKASNAENVSIWWRHHVQYLTLNELTNSRVTQCVCWMTCSAPSGAEVCTFLFWMVHCGMPGRCAVGWVRLVYHYYCLTDLSKLLCGTYDVEICFMLYLLVCIRFHVILVSCDCIMKCIFVWTQVLNKLLLLLLVVCRVLTSVKGGI